MSVCLVTGATGFIGSALCRQLLAQGHKVVSVSRTASSNKNVLRCHLFDLGDQVWPDDLFTDITHVFHLAANAHSDARDIEQIELVNHHATLRLAQLAQQSNVKSFVFVSSILAAVPDSGAYAGAKYRAEQALLALQCETMRVAILRPALVYGPGVGGNLGRIMSWLIAGRFPPPPPAVGVRPMIALADLLEAIMLSGFSDQTPTTPMVICDGEHYSLRTMFEVLSRGFGKRVPAWYLPGIFWKAAGLGGDLLSVVPGLSALPGRETVRRMFADVALPGPETSVPGWRATRRLEDCVDDMCNSFQATE